MADKGNKNRKYGRNKQDCTAYKNAGRRERNKARRMVRTLKRQPNNALLAFRVLELNNKGDIRIGADERAYAARVWKEMV